MGQHKSNPLLQNAGTCQMILFSTFGALANLLFHEIAVKCQPRLQSSEDTAELGDTFSRWLIHTYKLVLPVDKTWVPSHSFTTRTAWMSSQQSHWLPLSKPFQRVKLQRLFMSSLKTDNSSLLPHSSLWRWITTVQPTLKWLRFRPIFWKRVTKNVQAYFKTITYSKRKNEQKVIIQEIWKRLINIWKSSDLVITTKKCKLTKQTPSDYQGFKRMMRWKMGPYKCEYKLVQPFRERWWSGYFTNSPKHATTLD